MTIARAFEPYIGVPWVDRGRSLAGCDCWGLVVIVFREVHGIELPSYDGRYVSAEDRRDIARLIAGGIGDWNEVTAGLERAFDGVLLRDGRVANHMGVVVEPGRMLHVARGRSSVIESYRTGVTRHRVTGFFRYHGCADDQ